MKAFKLCILSGVLLLGNISAFPQAANEQGIKPYGSFNGSDLDQVSISNNHLELRIPVLGYLQRGNRLTLNFVARYHNAVWNEHTDCVQTTSICFHIWEFDHQPGMQVVTEQTPPMISQTAVGFTNTSNPIYTYAVVAADESQHPLGNIGGTAYETLDTTGIKWDSSTQTFTLSNGSRYLESNTSAPVLEDANGNQITFTYGSAINDTLGRTIPWPGGSGATQDFSGCTGSLPISSAALWVVPGSNGTSNTFKLCFAQVKIFTHHWTLQDTSTNKYVEPNAFYSMLQSIVLPDQTAWTFDYSQPDANGVNWGDLVKLTLPSGGSIAYTWGHGAGCHHLFGPPGSWSGGVSQRVIDAQDGSGTHTWTYHPGAALGQRVVTNPLNDDTVHTLTDLNTSCSFYETRTEFYKGSQTGGTLLKTVSTDYSWTPNINGRSSGGLNPPPINVVPIRKTTSWPTGQVRKTEFTYDAGFTYNSDWGSSATPPTATGIYGKETAVNEFDYGAGTPGALLKSTQTSYLWQSPAGSQYLNYNVLEVPTTITAKGGSGATASQTTLNYDEAVPAGSGISTSHDFNPTNGNVRGNPTSVSRWLSGSTVSTTNCPVAVTNGFLTSKKSYLDTGMVSQSKDACGQPTNFLYSSLYAGAYLTSSCDAFNHCSTMDYNFNPGLISTVTDPNGQITGKKTTYVYDDIGRVTSVTYPDGGQTNAFYPNATTIEVKKLQDATAGVWIDTYSYFDGLLRPKQTRLVDPEGDVYTDTTYDAMGRIATVSNPHRNVTAPTDGITTKNYDTLGRVTSVTHPDNNVLQTVYSDPGVVTLIDETGRRRRETTDALGRLIRVEEPSAANPGSKATASVNIGGALQSKVLPGANATAGSGSVTITGSDASTIVDPCAGQGGDITSPVGGGGGSCPQTVYDSGTVSITINGHADSTSYGSSSTAATVATGLAAAINGDSGAFVNASASNGVLTLTARQTGAATNYSWSISSSSSDPGDFGSAGSFSASPTSGALTNGANASSGGTVWDAGTVTLSLDGYSATVNYGNGTGQDSTASTVAADLISRIDSQLPTTNSAFTISVPAGGTTITAQWSTIGPAGNSNTLTVNATTAQTSNFSVPSFAGCQPISANPQNCSVSLSGGADPFSLDAPPSWPTLYSYDLLNNLLRVEQHGSTTDSTQWRVRTFQHDSLSRLTQSNNPEAGQLTFTYDADGNVITRTDSRAVTVTRAYDALNRLTQERYSDGTAANSFAYDQTSMSGVSLSNTVGRLSSTSAGSTVGSILSYDPMGRAINEYVCLPSNCGTGSYPIAAQYDLAGHLKSLAYPSGRTITSGYNSAGRALNSVFTNFAGQAANYSYYTVPQGSTASAWGYNPDGSLRVGAFGNGISETYGFNNRLQLNAITASSSSQTWLSKIYGLYDVNNHDNGTIWSIVDGINSNRSQSFQYDAVGRVISGSQQDGAFNQTFSYDPWGNMTTSGTSNFNQLYDGSNRISGAPVNCTGANQYCYDSAGNMLNDGYHQYAFDGYNRIKTVDGTGATYTYGAAGERVRKNTGGKSTEYVYFQGSAIAEKDLSTGYWSDYVFFNGRRIARANNFEHQLHVSGQVCANCGWQWYQFNLTNLGALAGRTIQAGDSLRWVQWSNGGSKGGIIITYTDGTDSCCGSAPLIADQNGELILRGNMSTNQWEYRVASLSPVAGKAISQIRLYADGQTTPGQWDLYFQDLVFTAADGTVIPLFSQNATAPALSGFGSTGMTQTSASIHDCSGSGCAPMNTTTYFHGDQIGSARLLSAGYGYPVWQGMFTPFGQEVSPEITTNHYKFNGRERGEATEGGLDYFGARYYSSTIGRWMTPDWSDEPSPVPYSKLTNPQSLNLYSYVTDDPLSHTDLDGHFQSHIATTQPCPQAPNGGSGDACTMTTSTQVVVGGTLFGGGSVVGITQTTTTTYTDQNGDKIDISTTRHIQATYDENQNVTHVSELTATNTYTNGKFTGCSGGCTGDYREWKDVKMSTSDVQKAMGGAAGRVMDMVVQNARPGLYTGAVNQAVHHPGQTLERAGAAVALGACLLAPGCKEGTLGVIGAVAGAAGGAGAVASEIYKWMIGAPQD